MPEPKFRVGEALTFSWETLKENIGFLVVVGAVVTVTDVLLGFIPVNHGHPWLNWIGRTLVPFLVNIALTLVMTRVALDLYDTGSKKNTYFLALGPYYLILLLAELIPFLISQGMLWGGRGLAFLSYSQPQWQWLWGLLFILLAFANQYLMIRFWFIPYFVVDQDMGIKALGKSWSTTGKMLGPLVLLWLVLGVLGFVTQPVNWATFMAFVPFLQKVMWVTQFALVGQVLLIPFRELAIVYVYRKLEPASTEVTVTTGSFSATT